MPINMSVEFPKLETENQKLKRLLHDLTPGGSEFYNNPEYCAKWIRENRQQEAKILKEMVKAAKDKNEVLQADNERLLNSHKSAMLTAMEFGYKECEKGNNLDMAFINFNKALQNK